MLLQIDDSLQDLRRLLSGFLHAHDYVYRYYDVLRFGSVHVDVDDVLALWNAAAIGDFVIIFGRSPLMAEVVAQQI